MSNAESWNRAAERYQSEQPATGETIAYGRALPTDAELRLLGTSELKGKRVLELGCRTGNNAIALARLAAHVIAIDVSRDLVAAGRRAADAAEVRVEWRVGDLADLAFLRADSIDLAVCAMALTETDDLGRVLRQVHRVLKNGAPFVFSLEHPMALALVDGTGTRSYLDRSPMTVQRYGQPFTLYPRSVAEVFTSLTRTGYRVDVIAEPPPASKPDAPIPAGIIFRARKEGV
jgi:ubiquinone/menaquinone biosynthesis C-methylase UbiE